MSGRFLVGLLKGLLVGALLCLAWLKGLGSPDFTGLVAYLAAALTGLLVGLVAGKPIWAKGAQIEAGLKSVAGALFGAAALYGMRKWLHVELELGPLGAGRVGDVVTFALPAIAALLGVALELDNTGSEPADDRRAPVTEKKQRVPQQVNAELEGDERASELGQLRRKS